jgi:hypothetical protein
MTYMNNTQSDVLRRASTGNDDAASHVTERGNGYDAALAPWSKHMMHVRADSERRDYAGRRD